MTFTNASTNYAELNAVLDQARRPSANPRTPSWPAPAKPRGLGVGQGFGSSGGARRAASLPMRLPS